MTPSPITISFAACGPEFCIIGVVEMTGFGLVGADEIGGVFVDA